MVPVGMEAGAGPSHLAAPQVAAAPAGAPPPSRAMIRRPPRSA